MTEETEEAEEPKETEAAQAETEKSTKPLRTLLIAAIALLMSLIMGGIIFDSMAQLVQTYNSPDGRFTVEVYAYPRIGAMPGQGSDRPGKVRLVTTSGAVLNQYPLEMLQNMSEPLWSTDTVSIPHVVDWNLPSEKETGENK